MTTIFIDKKPYDVRGDQNLLSACLSLGFEIPYFCWHPVLHSVGSCRQCAVKLFKDEKDTRGRIVMSCMTPVSEGMHISIDDPEVKAYRRHVIEWLMLNHPHDCPICDEGGECHLQDMTVLTGHNYRRNRFKKRTYRNQDLGPFINHEMNRCIQCYRCIRFYRDYAGGRDLGAFASHHHVYFGRSEDGVLESAFSGNLVEICPTGVFTDKTFKKHYTRSWDLQTAPSVCVHCGLGCNIFPGERYGKLRRIRNRYNGEVNGYFLCDRGRFGYEFVNSSTRLRKPIVRKKEKRDIQVKTGGTTKGIEADVVAHISDIVTSSGSLIGIGSPRASLEANFSLRALVGEKNFYSGISEREMELLRITLKIMGEGPAPVASLAEVEQADAILVLGEDVLNTAPLLELALRQASIHKPESMRKKFQIPEWNDLAVREIVQDERGPLFVATPYPTSLDELAAFNYHGAFDDIARFGFVIAHAIHDEAPGVPNFPGMLLTNAETIARTLLSAEHPLVVAGVSCLSESVLHAAANVAWALCRSGKQARIFMTVPECNSLGLALFGGRSLSEAFHREKKGAEDTVIILENDLYRRADAGRVDNFLHSFRSTIAVDLMENRTTAQTEIVLPAASFAEGSGTLINSEGRSQRFFKVYDPGYRIKESWKWIRDIMVATGKLESNAWGNLDSVLVSMVDALPFLEPVLRCAPGAHYRSAGLRVPRQPHRFSGRTAMSAQLSVHEPPPLTDSDSPFAFSMEGSEQGLPSSLIPRYWAPGWNSVQSLNKFQQEVGGSLIGGNPGVRVLETVQGDTIPFFTALPEPFSKHCEEFLILPLYHIFGSEELSAVSEPIAGLVPDPYLGFSPDAAGRLLVEESERVFLQIGELTIILPIRIIPGLSDGLALVPSGLPGLKYVDLPARGRVTRETPGENKKEA